MALRIKLARGGSTHNPVYRIVVGEARSKRDGKYVEWIGTYSPKAARGQLKINLERADYWVSVGAKPTDTVRSLINKTRRSTLEELEGPAPVKEKAPAPASEAAKPAEETPADPEKPAEEAESAVAEEVSATEESAPPAQETPATEESAPAEEEAEDKKENKDS